MKYRLLLLLIFGYSLLCESVTAQEKSIRQLKKELAVATHDTTRCLLLNLMINSETNEAMWPVYNEQLLQISEKNARNPESAQLKKFYLQYLGDAYNNIGYFADEQGDVFRAISYYQKSLDIKKEIQDQQGIATALNNIGYIYDNLGDIPQALDYYHKALKIREQIGDRKGIASSFNNLGYVYRMQGNFEKSIEYHLKSLSLYRKESDSRGIANSLLNLGVIYKKKGDIKKALDYYSQALQIQKKNNDRYGIATSMLNIGAIYEKKKMLPKADQYFLQSLSIFKEINDKQGITKALNNLAGLCFKKGEMKEALFFANESMKFANELGYPEDIQGAASTLSQIFQKQGKYKEAFELFDLEIRMRDSIKNKETESLTIQRQFQYQYDKKAASDSVKYAEVQKVKNAQLTAQRAEILKEKTQKYALYGGLLLVISFTIFVWNRFKVTQGQKRIIENQKRTVEEHQKEILASISYAKRLQDAILPPLRLIDENTADFFIYYKPKDIVAGDFYWAESTDEYFYIAAADCTGHGVPGALVSMVCSNALNRTVNELGIKETGDILGKVRELVLRVFSKSSENINDGMDISLCRINKKTREIQWSGANNPLWYFRGEQLIEIKGDKQHIGKTENAQPFHTHHIVPQENDVFYIFTDGFSDQFGGPKGKKFKIRSFAELLMKNKDLPLPQQLENIDTAFLAWQGELEQLDDVCVVGIRF